jgi:Kef-type K+ transport system membrane component KefB
VNTPFLWGITAIIILFVIFAKGIACMLAAKLAGESWQDSLTIGVLINVRYLMKLIILNIGLEQGIITPTLFIIIVIMAIVTTLMASPLVAVLLNGKSFEQSLA